MLVLIVDDDETRAFNIKRELSQNGLCNIESIDIANNIQNARKYISAKLYTILILDVMLPKRDEPALAKNGLNFLKEIAHKSNSNNPKRKLNKPDTIIGITANIEDISLYRDEFYAFCFSVIEAPIHSGDWLKKLINAVQYKLSTKISNECNQKKIICVTIHGIESTGKWQTQLQDKINLHTSEVLFETYKYGLFSFITFLFSLSRNREVKRFKYAMETMVSEHPDKDIYIFCHSFGTYVAVKALEYLSINDAKNIKLLVLSGSVLKQSYDFTQLLKSSSVKIVNDCGTDDLPLLVSELLVFGMGMGGRVGFKGRNNRRFTNRYFRGGHSHYFKEKGKFIEKYWLPFFENIESAEIIDQREPGGISNSVSTIIGTFGGLKAFYVPTMIAFGLFLFFV
ncbi:hypothetical protein D3C80_93050 [compost metagenome]